MIYTAAFPRMDVDLLDRKHAFHGCAEGCVYGEQVVAETAACNAKAGPDVDDLRLEIDAQLAEKGGTSEIALDYDILHRNRGRQIDEGESPPFALRIVDDRGKQQFVAWMCEKEHDGPGCGGLDETF
ncbi:MAG: hypothetical protein R3D44_00765 [Hyphomicrobiaceae bacterium]